MTAQDHLFSAPQVALTNDDWYTPKWIFDAMGIEFDVDVAAPPGGVPWIPANRVLTKAEDGLLQPWSGRVWMNPPFSKTQPWFEKFEKHRQGVALLPLGKSRWVDRLWASNAHLALIPSNLKFHKAGKPTSMMMSAVLVTFEAELVSNLAKIGKVR